MIIEPVPASPRSRRRRALALAALVFPVALLAAVVGLGVSGERPAEDTAAVSLASPAALAPSSPAASGAPPLPAAGRPALADLKRVAGYPAVLDTLRVRTVAEVLAAPPDPGEIVAISGVLAFETIVAGCDAASPLLATFCGRSTILADRPIVLSSSPANLGPRLHPLAPGGVRLPRALLPDPTTGERSQVPVVVFATVGADGVRLERVAWVGGNRWRAPAIDPALGRNPYDETWWRRRLAAEDALGLTARNGTPVLLMTAYLQPATLAALEPAAAVAARAAAADARAMWFVRALYPGGVGEGTPRRDEVRWIVVDDLSGAIVARGTGEAG